MKKAKILIVDDDKDIRELLSHYFKANHYDVVVYADPQKALEDIIQERIGCDVIITDLMLPNITGIEFTQRLKASGYPAPIILITANKKVETAVKAIASGAYDFVVKPLHLSQLQVSVERALYLSQIKEENNILKNVVHLQEGHANIEGIIGKSLGIKAVIDIIRRSAKTTANIMITGEVGVGKYNIARIIHSLGTARGAPFVTLNCSSLPASLVEAEVFGTREAPGLIEQANGGTLYIEDVSELNTAAQARLLRILQEKKIKRNGENHYRPVSFKIISATHKNLKTEIAQGKLRENLFFRLNVIPIYIPALRQRKDDIPLLADFYLRKYCALIGSRLKKFSKQALENIINYSWPGNEQELENVVERAVLLSSDSVINSESVVFTNNDSPSIDNGAEFSFASSNQNKILTIDEMINKYVQYVLKINNGVKEKTARDLKIDRKTLYRRLKEIDDKSNYAN